MSDYAKLYYVDQAELPFALTPDVTTATGLPAERIEAIGVPDGI